MAESGQTPNRGLSATIESIVSKMGALLLNRVELFLLEARSAKQKVWTGLVLTVLGIFSVFMAMLFTLIMIILLAPESWRAGLLGGVTGCFLLFALIAFWLVKRSIQNPWFENGVNAVKEDWQTLTQTQQPSAPQAARELSEVHDE